MDDDVLGHVSRCLELPARSPAPAPDRVALRSQCVAAKEALSTDMSVDLAVALPTGTRSVRLTREELDELITDAVEASVEAVRRAVADAGLALEDLDAVLLAGGGARIPLVAETLSAELGRPLFAAADPAFSAAQGAAALALDLGTAGAVATDEPDDVPDADDQRSRRAGRRRGRRARDRPAPRLAPTERCRTCPRGGRAAAGPGRRDPLPHHPGVRAMRWPAGGSWRPCSRYSCSCRWPRRA